MNETDQLNRLLRQALAPTAEPDEQLNRSLIRQLKERNVMKRGFTKRLSAGLLVAALAIVMSVTAYAATHLFTPKEVAEHLGERMLAEAFASSDAIEINKSAASGDYNMTLHGIVSGAGLKGLEDEVGASDIYPERTYAVVSIARLDGSPMPDTSDPAYGEEPFFVSPFIKGLKPWQINIATMSGGYSEFVADGIMYRLIECDIVEMFADKGVYLAVASGTSFYSEDAFAYDERSGGISVRTDYEGAAVLFDLPLDESKADPVRAEAYLKQHPLLNPAAEGRSGLPQSAEERELLEEIEAMKARIPDGTVIPESIKEVTYDDQGRLNYEHDGWSVKLSPDLLFAEGQTGYSDSVNFSSDGTRDMALRFHKDEDGVITGRIVVLE